MNYRELISNQKKETEENEQKAITGNLYNIVCHNLQKNCNLDLVNHDMTIYINEHVSLHTGFKLYYSHSAKQKLYKTEIWSTPCDQSYKLVIDSDELRMLYNNLLEREKINETDRIKGQSNYKSVQKEDFRHQDLLLESKNIICDILNIVEDKIKFERDSMLTSNIEIIDLKPRKPSFLVVKQFEHYSSCYSISFLVPGTKYKWNYIEEKSHNSIIMSEIYDKKICKENFKSNYENCPIFKPVNAIIDESKLKITIQTENKENNKMKESVNQKDKRLTASSIRGKLKQNEAIKEKHEEEEKKEKLVRQFIDMRHSKESAERMNLIFSTIEKKFKINLKLEKNIIGFTDAFKNIPKNGYISYLTDSNRFVSFESYATPISSNVRIYDYKADDIEIFNSKLDYEQLSLELSTYNSNIKPHNSLLHKSRIDQLSTKIVINEILDIDREKRKSEEEEVKKKNEKEKEKERSILDLNQKEDEDKDSNEVKYLLSLNLNVFPDNTPPLFEYLSKKDRKAFRQEEGRKLHLKLEEIKLWLLKLEKFVNYMEFKKNHFHEYVRNFKKKRTNCVCV